MNFLGSFNLNVELVEYNVPIYYIVGEQDWQTPVALTFEALSGIWLLAFQKG